MENANVVKLAVDAYHGKVDGNFSLTDSMETLRKALVDLNGGSTKLDYKKIRDGKCNGLFSVVEQILQKTIIEGFKDDAFFNTLVEMKVTALGDINDFYIPGETLFVVSDISRGNQALRRQRIDDGEHVRIPTQTKGIKIYEELDRVLSGRVDFNYFIDLVGKSMKQALYVDIYTALNALAGSGSVYFPVAGSYSEEALVALIDHVEAATGKKAVILGSRQALRTIATNAGATTSAIADIGNEGKADMYALGYYGKFNGTDCIKINQAHIPGTTTFAIDNKKLYVMALDDKPIKVVNEGEPTIYLGNPMDNADMSQDYLYIDSWGVGVAATEQMGIYSFT